MLIIELGEFVLRVGVIEPLGSDPDRVPKYYFGRWLGGLTRPNDESVPVVTPGDLAAGDLEPDEQTIELPK